jgi:hypothetical protein
MSSKGKDSFLPVLLFIAVIVFRDQIMKFINSFFLQKYHLVKPEEFNPSVNLKEDNFKIEEEKKFYTINEILAEFKISRQTFFNYRKFVKLEPVAKFGRYSRFSKKDVLDFFENISIKKKENPELFQWKLFTPKSQAS